MTVLGMPLTVFALNILFRFGVPLCTLWMMGRDTHEGARIERELGDKLPDAEYWYRTW